MTQQVAPFPNFVLEDGSSVVLWGLDPSDGSYVLGVIITDISIYGETAGGSYGTLPPSAQFLPFLPYGANT